MKKKIGVLLTSTLLLSLFACDETQQKDQQLQEAKPVPEIKQIQPVAPTKVETVLPTKKDNWADAKNSTKQALEQSKKAGKDIWEASKDTSVELLNSGKEKSKETWVEIKEKSQDVMKKSNNTLEQLMKSDDKKPIPKDNDDEI